MKPLFDAVPESNSNAEVIKELNGNNELQNITFNYGENTKPIFNDLNLKINKDDYVAIVGHSDLIEKNGIFKRLVEGQEE